jgi:hypothetical protein
VDPQRKRELDHMTVVVYQLAIEFGVSWRAAAHRAIGLDLMSWQDLEDIEQLAREERAWAILSQ